MISGQRWKQEEFGGRSFVAKKRAAQKAESPGPSDTA